MPPPQGHTLADPMANHSGNTSDSSVSDRATFGKRSRKEPTPSAFTFGAPPSETPSPYSFASTEHSAWLPPATMLQGDLKGLLRSRDSWDGERSLPLTPRSPSPTFSPTASPKRQCAEPPPGALSALATEDDLESRAAALGLTEATQRAWRETVIPPTPPSPSPTFSLPSSPKRRDGESRATADQFAAAQSFKTTATLVAERLEQGGASRSPNLTMPPWETSYSMPPPNAPASVERFWLGSGLELGLGLGLGPRLGLGLGPRLGLGLGPRLGLGLRPRLGLGLGPRLGPRLGLGLGPRLGLGLGLDVPANVENWSVSCSRARACLRHWCPPLASLLTLALATDPGPGPGPNPSPSPNPNQVPAFGVPAFGSIPASGSSTSVRSALSVPAAPHSAHGALSASDSEADEDGRYAVMRR